MCIRDREEAIMRVEPAQLDQLLHPVLDPASKKSLKKLATGLPASPGAAVGKIVFTADDAVVASQKAPVILVRKETVPDDIHGMEVSKGILTARGGMTSHAAVVARDARNSHAARDHGRVAGHAAASRQNALG